MCANRYQPNSLFGGENVQNQTKPVENGRKNETGVPTDDSRMYVRRHAGALLIGLLQTLFGGLCLNLLCKWMEYPVVPFADVWLVCQKAGF